MLKQKSCRNIPLTEWRRILQKVVAKEMHNATFTYKEEHLLKRLQWIIDKVNGVRRLFKKEHLRILDMGGGTGMVAFPLAALGHKVLLVDISPENIAWVKARNPFHNLEFLCADCTSDSFPHEVGSDFDVIIASDVIEHVEHPRKLVFNAVRCSTRGTLFLFTTVNALSQSEIVLLLLHKIRLYNMAKTYKRCYIDSRKTEEELARTGSINLGLGAPHIQRFTLDT
jgi:2-polyprenyl-3-methyl-5-hydroxy-6-metoxy-1,4-benzoquinol methylase